MKTLMIIEYVSSIIAGILLIKHTNYVEMKLEKGLSRLTKSQKKKLIFILIVISIAVVVSFNVYYKVAKMCDDLPLIPRLIVYFTKITFIYDEWIRPTMVVYSTVFYVIHSAKIDEISKLQSNVDYFTWLKFLIETKKTNNSFEKNLSLFPSMWLVNAFMGSAGILEILGNLGLDFYLSFIWFNALWISSIVLVAKLYDDLEKLVDITKLRIYSNCSISSSDKVAINLLLNDLVAVKVTASSIVTLEKSLFLPCLGYIITYTLLLKEQFKY